MFALDSFLNWHYAKQNMTILFTDRKVKVIDAGFYRLKEKRILKSESELSIHYQSL